MPNVVPSDLPLCAAAVIRCDAGSCWGAKTARASPGARCAEIVASAIETAQGKAVGHGIGRDDAPRPSPDVPERGMLLRLEAPFRTPGAFGPQVEHTL